MSSTQTATQPGALDGAGLRRVVMVLSTVQIVSRGCLCYPFAAPQSSVTVDTGWSGVAVTGAFSLSLVVSGVARSASSRNPPSASCPHRAQVAARWKALR